MTIRLLAELLPPVLTQTSPPTHPLCLEDLEFPGVLVLVVQAVHSREAQFPGLLVLVVQAVNGSEAQGGGSAVAL